MFGLTWLLIFKVFSILVRWLVKYGRVLNILQESPLEEPAQKAYNWEVSFSKYGG